MKDTKSTTRKRKQALKTETNAVPSVKQIMADCGCSESTAHRLRRQMLEEGNEAPMATAKEARRWQARRWRSLALLSELELGVAQKKLIALEDVSGLFQIANETMNYSWQSMLEELPPRLAGKDIIDVRIELEKSINAALHRYKDTFDKFADDHRPIREIAADPNLPVIISCSTAK